MLNQSPSSHTKIYYDFLVHLPPLTLPMPETNTPLIYMLLGAIRSSIRVERAVPRHNHALPISSSCETLCGTGCRRDALH